jgi:hypothetical protein
MAGPDPLVPIPEEELARLHEQPHKYEVTAPEFIV